MLTLRELFNQTLLARSSWVRLRRRRRVLRHLSHFFTQAKRPHVCPHFLDVGQAFSLRAYLSVVLPAQRILFVLGPYGVLLFVVHNNFVDCSVFLVRVVPTHFLTPLNL